MGRRKAADITQHPDFCGDPTTGEVYISTYTGNKFYLSRPVFDIRDISHSLSMQCRYTGHCTRRFSTAEHSVLVSRIMEDYQLGDPFEGLMHDAHEAYLCDLAKPWKSLMPEFNASEARIEAACRKHFHLEGDRISEGAKIGDTVSLFLEAEQIINGFETWDVGWAPPKAHEIFAIERAKTLGNRRYHIMCFDPEAAKREFMGRFRKYWDDAA